MSDPTTGNLRVLFFVEGFTDIRFVVGLSRFCDLTLAVAAQPYEESGLKQRIADSGARLGVVEIPGGRLAFQARSAGWLWANVRRFDVVLSQEVLRGSLNATVIGRLLGVPVVTYMAIAPVEYFRCRRQRRQVGPVKAFLGETVIKALMTVNGRLAARCVALGPYLREVAARYSPHTELGRYYGVDTELFRPAHPSERVVLRRHHDLPTNQFLVLLSSRISHEKDPETVLRATALVRRRGLDAGVLNLGGGYQEFLSLARAMNLPDVEMWVLGRPAVHPMNGLAPYYQLADVTAQASLVEGLGLSPLESLACGTPVVATAVGGMARTLPGYARLVPPRDPWAMAEQFLWVAANPVPAREQALHGREYVVREWGQIKAYESLLRVLHGVTRC